MGAHAGQFKRKFGKQNGLHSDKPVLEPDDYADEPFLPDEEAPYYDLSIRRGRWHLKRIMALAAVALLISAGCWYIIANQTDSSRYVLSEPSGQPNDHPTAASPADPVSGSQPSATATVTAPGVRQTVQVTVPPMAPQSVPTPTPQAQPTVTQTQTVYQPARPAPTVTVTKTVPVPGPTVTVTKKRPSVAITVTVPATVPTP